MFKFAATKIAHNTTIPAFAGANPNLRPLQDLITAEKSVLESLQKLSTDLAKASEALRIWGQREGDDLGDILGASTTLLSHFSGALATWASLHHSIRDEMKAVRTREEVLDDMRRRRKRLAASAESAEQKLNKMSHQHKDLGAQTQTVYQLREEIRRLDAEIIREEAALGDLKRRHSKNWMTLKFGGLVECCEKGIIAGDMGKCIIKEISDDVTTTGVPRPPYTSRSRVNDCVVETQRAVSQVKFSEVHSGRRHTGTPSIPEDIQDQSAPFQQQVPLSHVTAQPIPASSFGSDLTVNLSGYNAQPSRRWSIFVDELGVHLGVNEEPEPVPFSTLLARSHDSTPVPDKPRPLSFPTIGNGTTGAGPSLMVSIIDTFSRSQRGDLNDNTSIDHPLIDLTVDEGHDDCGRRTSGDYDQLELSGEYASRRRISSLEADGNSDNRAIPSYPRSSHPDDAGFIFSSSPDSTAKVPNGILHVDKDSISPSDLQREAQLLMNCMGHNSVTKNETLDAKQYTLGSSLAILALRLELKELKQQKDALVYRNGRLEDKVAALKNAVQQKVISTEAATCTTALSRQDPKQGRRNYSQPNAVAGPSRLPLGSVRTAKSDTYKFEDDILEKMQSNFLEQESKESTIQSLNLAFKLQETFDAEDAALHHQRAELESHLQKKFGCGICLEECPEDDSATVESCGHTMCRSCMKRSISAKIIERRFPILCPICAADNSGCPPAEISDTLVELIGITKEEYKIWKEMQLSEYCILLHCRKCKRAAFVDRHDYNDMPNVACPLPDCNHIWCKFCNRSIKIRGPKHSCDGSSELDHLMKKKGWKYCPNCKTAILKEDGCNHMRCIAPGCNTHFCYLCGGLIIRSSVKDEISREVDKHYSKKCDLFQVPK